MAKTLSIEQLREKRTKLEAELFADAKAFNELNEAHRQRVAEDQENLKKSRIEMNRKRNVLDSLDELIKELE